MILTCERCETRFRLDESRLPAGGARVRCSRCKHAFFVNPGGAPAPEAVHEAAEAALTQARPPAPAPSWDLEEDPNARTAQSMTTTRASLAPEPLSGDFEEEADWRFEDEMQLGDSGASLDLPNGEAPAPPNGDPNDSSFAELGDPESWDLLSNTAAPEPVVPRPPIPEPVIEAPPKPAARAAAKTPAIAQRERVEPIEVLAPVEEAPALLLEPELSPALRTGAWIGVAVLIAVASWTSLAPLAPAAPQRAVVSLGELELDALQLRQVENAWAGPVWVVSGELHNPGGAPQAVGKALAVELLDASGERIEGATAVAQPSLSAERLREDDPVTWNEDAERAATELASQTLAPGARVPVVAVFATPALRATRFAVEARAPRPPPPAPIAQPAPIAEPAPIAVDPAPSPEPLAN